MNTTKKTGKMWLYALFFPILLPLQGQETDPESQKVRIETKDGNEFFGDIISEDEQTLTLRTANLGDISIRKTDIKKRTVITISEVKDGDIWFRNFQASRHFWSPNGYGLKRGEAYYQNVWVLFNQASVGFNDYFSIGLGMVPVFLFGESTPIWLLPKVSVPVVKDKVNVGGGALIGTIAGESSSSFGIVYSSATFGSIDKNFTVGLGKGYAEGEFADGVVTNLASIIRTGQRGYFITETYLFSQFGEVSGFTLIGGRRLLRNVGFDYALGMPINAGFDQFIAIPWLGLTIPLGPKQ